MQQPEFHFAQIRVLQKAIYPRRPSDMVVVRQSPEKEDRQILTGSDPRDAQTSKGDDNLAFSANDVDSVEP